jgi:membrane-bound lytic murein transglycosylase D
MNFLLDNKAQNNVNFKIIHISSAFLRNYYHLIQGKEPDLRQIGIFLVAGLLCVQLASCVSVPQAKTVTKVFQIDPAISPAGSPQDPSHPALIQQTEETPAITAPQIQPQAQPQEQANLIPPDASASTSVPGGPPIVEENSEGDEDAVVTEDEITYDVPIIINESVEAHIEYFQTVIRDRFELWLSRSGRYIPLMKETFKSYGLPEDLVFVALIESGFNPVAYSRAKAVGPWQFIRSTGKKYGLRIDDWVDERRDPVKSTIAAAKYLRDLYNMFESWPLALASYNAGEGRVMRAMARTRSDDFWDLRTSRYLRRETKNYVPKYMAATIIAKNPEKYGFKLDLWEPLQFDEVIIESPTDLRVIAQAAGVPYQDLRELNPELRSTITPLNYKDYVLKLPYGTKQAFFENFATIPPEKRMIQLRHRIRKGETLSTLSRRYGTSVQAIRELNGLTRGHTIRQGNYLLIPMSSKVAARQERVERNQSSIADEDPELKKITYKVRRGDTLWRISKNFNVSVSMIRKWNGLHHTSTLRAGERLVLYVKAEES